MQQTDWPPEMDASYWKWPDININEWYVWNKWYMSISYLYLCIIDRWDRDRERGRERAKEREIDGYECCIIFSVSIWVSFDFQNAFSPPASEVFRLHSGTWRTEQCNGTTRECSTWSVWGGKKWKCVAIGLWQLGAGNLIISESIHVDSEISGYEKATAFERLQCYPCPVFNANHLAKNESVLPFCYDAYVGLWGRVQWSSGPRYVEI